MTTKSDPAVALKGAIAMATRSVRLDSAPAPSGLVPPGGAYFGRLQVSHQGSCQVGTVPPDCNSQTGNTQTGNWQAVDEFFVYWQNGSTSNPGSYVIIQKETVTFSIGNQVCNDTLHQGYLLFGSMARTQMLPADASDPSAVVTLVATSPNSGDTYASVNQYMTLDVYTGSGSQPQAFNATDQTALSLTDWAVQNRQSSQDLLAKWYFYQTSPWNAANYDGSGTPPPNWTDVVFKDGICVPFTAISQSSLSATAYAVWTISQPAWTQNAPPVYSITGGQIFSGSLFLVWAWGGSNSNTPGYAPYGASDFGGFNLQLDQIAVRTPAGH
jgi:hypothetical protein